MTPLAGSVDINRITNASEVLTGNGAPRPLKLEPGGIYVIQCDQILSKDQAAMVAEKLAQDGEKLGVKFMLLQRGLTIVQACDVCDANTGIGFEMPTRVLLDGVDVSDECTKAIRFSDEVGEVELFVKDANGCFVLDRDGGILTRRVQGRVEIHRPSDARSGE